MHHNANSRTNPELEANGNNSYTHDSQPWWHGVGQDGISPDMLRESMSNISSPRQPINSALGTKTSKSQVKGGMDGRTDANTEMLITVVPQADGKFREQQLAQHTASIMHPPLGEYLTPPTQLELVGQSLACASYPYSDSYYGGGVPAYGPQALVTSHCVGVHSTRMALPLEMAEEPVYVNAKQYHGILRRRQLRAKAELAKKLIKVRKPYLHESRHLHAMRRARGCGGRFLNTKKLDNQPSNATTVNGTSSAVTFSTQPPNSSSSESVPTKHSRTADSSTGHQVVTENQVHEMQTRQKCFNGHSKNYSVGNGNGNGNGCYTHHQGFQLFNSLSDSRVERGDLSGQKSERIVANGAQHRVLTIK